MMRGLSIIILAALVSLMAGVCFADGHNLTISAGAGAMSGTLDIAEAKGFFKQNGVNAKVVSYKKGKIAFEKYLAGKDSMATCNIVGIVLSDFDIEKHKLIAGLTYTDNQSIVLARKSAGITKPADLKGKRIGIPRATTGHFFFWKYMAVNGLNPKDVEIVFIKKNKTPAAIANGEVDAICLHGMPIEKAKKLLGDDWVAFQDDSLHRTSIQLVAPAKLIDENSLAIKAVLKGAIEAEEFIKANPAESVRIIAKAKGYPIDVMTPIVRKDIDFKIGLPQSLLLTLETVEQWAIDNKLVKRTKPRNYLKFIDHRPLENVNANKVAILR